MARSLLLTLLQLGHATSQNLAFAHQPNVHVSYGEETITETNLLEIRRWHHNIVRLETFTKQGESKVGADWEWWIIGRKYTFRMRIQAKRIQRNSILKIPHIVPSSGQEQIDLLIHNAKLQNFKPVYCFYSAENQRNYWNLKIAKGYSHGFETGCLLADARRVKAINPKRLTQIEPSCIPWHFLAVRVRCLKRFSRHRVPTTTNQFQVKRTEFDLESWEHVPENSDQQNFPTFSQLNIASQAISGLDGVVETGSIDLRSPNSKSAMEERSISRLIFMDVRELDLDD